MPRGGRRWHVRTLVGDRRWMKIGRATSYEGQFGPGIACTIEVTPVGWDGTFHLFPAAGRDNSERESEKGDSKA